MTKTVSLEPAKHVRIRLDQELVAESDQAFVVHETGLPDRYYVPRSDVRANLGEGTGQGICPWKGLWRHLDVTVDGKRIANGAWTYYDTKPVTDRMRDFVAFYESKFTIDVS